MGNKNVNNLPSSITISTKKLGKRQLKFLKQLYDGPIHVWGTGVQEHWRRKDDNQAEFAAVNGYSDFHIFPWSVFIEMFIPMEDRDIIKSEEKELVQIPMRMNKYMNDTLVTLWERGMVVVFSREVEKVEEGYRRIPMVLYTFENNKRGRNSRVFGVTLSTEGVYLCRRVIDEEEVELEGVTFI